MHHCFHISEVRQQIFSTVYSSDEDSLRRRHDSILLEWPKLIDSSSRQTLAALARTCRDFSEPALDILWARLDTLEPLVRCFPDSVWSVSDEGVIDLEEPILAVAWHEFRRHARRVHALGRASSLFGNMSKDFIIALGCFPSREGLLPNLRELYWYSHEDGDLDSFMRYFLTPTLRSIRISSFECTVIQCSMVSFIGAMCRELEIFEYSSSSPGSDDTGVLGFVSEYDWLSMDSLRALKIISPFRMPNCYLPHNLNTLSVRLIPEEWSSYGPQCMKTLETLELRSPTFLPCTCFIQKIEAPLLRKLIVDCESHPPAATIGKLFTSLQAQFPHSIMESITVKAGKPRLRNGDKYPCTMQAIRPLLAFSLIKELHLGSLNMSHIDDTDMHEIASSLPGIESLFLGTRYFWKETPRILDPVTQEKPGGGVMNTTITTLSVGCSKFHDPTEVAVVLSAVLPSLKKIVVETLGQNNDREARQEGWEEVVEWVQFFAKIREQERRKNGTES
ncbi:hypothetical protein BV22DRAFT_1045792 [Leucogyrophana mollusca]|uniref:Uncharacterized protein n=1 Tax=Leucogyrophana mollusca TaxID=85980 RepID=A0ACB8BLV6_9AGAM|nr:hypothetical protein BV22DRAFT_1045792 [Leucogyrophana mollusca]